MNRISVLAGKSMRKTPVSTDPGVSNDFCQLAHATPMLCSVAFITTKFYFKTQ